MFQLDNHMLVDACTPAVPLPHNVSTDGPLPATSANTSSAEEFAQMQRDAQCTYTSKPYRCASLPGCGRRVRLPW